MESRKRGFTLIELLIVIAIIGILSSIAIASYRIFKLRAYNNTALYDLKNLVNDEICYYGVEQKYASFSPSDINANGMVVTDNFTHRYLSDKVRAVAKVNGNYANFCTKHRMGDKIYAYQTGTDTIYYRKSKQGYELQDSECPNATANNDFPSPPWYPISQSK